LILSKPIRRLGKEAKRNPKRAIALGLLAFVAVWFWTPLIVEWICPKPKITADKDTASVDAPQSGQSKNTTFLIFQSKTKNSNNQKQEVDWKQLIKWIEVDAKTVATTGLAALRDPFTPVKPKLTSPAGTQLSSKAKELQKKTPPLAEVTPQSAGLSLSSTIVGPRVRVALINGRTYKQGQFVRVETGDDNGEDKQASVEFKLLEIQPEQATLERSNKKYTLTITKQKKSGLVVIEHSF